MSVLGQTEDGNRKWVYAAHIHGTFQRVHRWTGGALLAFLFVTPWLTVADRPALNFDLGARRLYLLGATFTVHDSFLVVLALLFAAFLLFFVTSLYGRVWCGYTCPQTVFLEELIRPIERFIEGSRSKRMQLDKKGWTPERIARRAAAWTAYAVVAIVVSAGLLSVFVAPELVWTGKASSGAYAVGAVVAGSLWFDFAWFREQFCNYLCPYARFQGALTDEQSLTVAYVAAEGEPRGRTKKGTPQPVTLDLSSGVLGLDGGEVELSGGGACIDCGKCVAVCPQGIDIRDGYQLQCINCARCIDACTGVMEKVGNPQSLIRYTTEAAVTGQPRRPLGVRTAVYGAMLAVLAIAMVVTVQGRGTFDATVNRVSGSLYTLDDDGWTRNTYFVQVTDKASDANAPVRDVSVVVQGLDGAEVVAPHMALQPDGTAYVPVAVRLPPEKATVRSLPFQVGVQVGDAADAETVWVPATFATGASAATKLGRSM